MIIVKRILFLIVLLLLVFLGTRRIFTFSKTESLHGVYESVSKPLFSDSSWTNGSFQEQYSRFVEDLPGLRETFIRIRNQYDYSIFSIPNARNVILGKNNCLFGIDNINSFQGSDFAGAGYLDVKANELKSLQDELWKKQNIFLMVIFTPDKATLFQDLIPERLLKKERNQSNYLYYSKKCLDSGINLIDFNRYFVLLKDTIKYPLYAKTGAHWSSYGAMIAADSMIHYIEKKLDIRLPEMRVDNLETTDVARNYDADIGSALNLFREISQPVLAYPKISFRQDSGTIRPSALFIGDSYYWNWYETGIIRNVFSNTEFWYYDSEVYPESNTKLLNTWHIDLMKAIERQKIIVLIQTSRGGECDFGYGFVDRTWPEYDTSANNRIRGIENFLTQAPSNMKIYEEKARYFNAPLKSVIRKDAIFAGNILLRKKK
jgi:hypothetical protein